MIGGGATAFAEIVAGLRARLAADMRAVGRSAHDWLGSGARSLRGEVESVGAVEARGLAGASERGLATHGEARAFAEAESAPGAAAAPVRESEYPPQQFIVKGGRSFPVSTADGRKWEATENGTGSAWAADRENIRQDRGGDGILRDRAEDVHVLRFKRGTTPGTQNKDAAYRDQIDRQIEGLNGYTARQVVDNYTNAKRLGTAQQTARDEYAAGRYEDELWDALQKDPAELGGATPEVYARARVDAEMEEMRALHEPDLAGGGLDRIGVRPDGTWSMGDKYVNSSLGSQWKRLRGGLRAYAEEQIRTGHGDELLNVRWRFG